MASAFTLQATTAEGQLAELMERLQILEANPDANPNNENRVTGTRNSDTQAFNGTVNLAFAPSIDAQGRVVYEVEEYLSDPVQGGN